MLWLKLGGGYMPLPSGESVGAPCNNGNKENCNL